jgi:hypothetical protein
VSEANFLGTTSIDQGDADVLNNLHYRTANFTFVSNLLFFCSPFGA